MKSTVGNNAGLDPNVRLTQQKSPPGRGAPGPRPPAGGQAAQAVPRLILDVPKANQPPLASQFSRTLESSFSMNKGKEDYIFFEDLDINAYKYLTTQEFFKIKTFLEQFKVYSKTNRKVQSCHTP